MQCSTLEDLTVAGGMLSIPILKGSVTPYRGLYIYQDPLTFMEGLSGDSIKSTGLAWRWGEECSSSLFSFTLPQHWSAAFQNYRKTSYFIYFSDSILSPHWSPNAQFSRSVSAIYARRYLAKQCSRVTVAKATQSWASKYWPHPHMCSGTRLMWYYWWDTELQIVQV